jgi:hypothetical protein
MDIRAALQCHPWSGAIPVITIALALAALSAVMFAWNVLLFRRLPARGAAARVSVLIPARNEERGIGEAIRSALASEGVEVEVVAYDDRSDDATAAIVRQLALEDGRVRLVDGLPLPAGWCGKQHACHQLAKHASMPFLCFIDADVRLQPNALRRMVAFQQASGADLVSGFPRQITVTVLERLLIPLIHFVLLGYLPIFFMRRSKSPGFAAGCGQLMLTTAAAYRESGGHSRVPATLHDGLRLPAQYRTARLRTDIFDATDVATCRMYRSAGQVWSGLAKNAVEGMAAPSRIVVFTVLLAGGHLLPFVLLAAAPSAGAAAAVALAYAVRAGGAIRFGHSVFSAVAHPVGIFVLLAIQWYSLVRHLLGLPAVWKDRAYARP